MAFIALAFDAMFSPLLFSAGDGEMRKSPIIARNGFDSGGALGLPNL